MLCSKPSLYEKNPDETTRALLRYNFPMLAESQVSEFRDRGFLLAKGLLRPADFAPLMREYEGALADLCAELTQSGELSRDHAGLPFARRYLAVCRETGRLFTQRFNFVLPRADIRPDSPIWLGPAVFGALTHPRILDAVESLMGPEIAVSPVGNVRIKPPERLIPESSGERSRGIAGATPWHQDNGVVTEDADETEMITAWFPLTDASAEAGCLQVLPGSHRGGMVCHCPDSAGELGIPKKLLPAEEPVPLPMKPGDVLFLHRRLLHASLPNTGETVRWSFDLRYIPVGSPSGREAFPCFTARSRANPQSEVRDPAEWRKLWLDARSRLSAGEGFPEKWNRWSAEAEMCA